MKNLLIGLVLSVAVSAPAFATGDEFCTWVGEQAVVTMEARQADMPIDDVMGLANNALRDFPLHIALLNIIILEAYAHPAMGTPEDEENQRESFSIKWMNYCFDKQLAAWDKELENEK